MLYCQVGRPADARHLLLSRQFQPWEGGEGVTLAAWTRTCQLLARHALAAGDASGAVEALEDALSPPASLGEARHLLANPSDVWFGLGEAAAAAGREEEAKAAWRRAATFSGDFQDMSVVPYSEMTYWSAQAWRRLGDQAQARDLLHGLRDHANRLRESEARIDYFATSLPTMLLFADDLQRRQETTALFLLAQAELGLGNTAEGSALLEEVLDRDPNHALAADLRSTLP